MGRRDRNNRRNNRQKSPWAASRPENKPRQKPRFNPETPADIAARESAIRDFKAREVICPACGNPIEDLSSAIADKNSGQPMHFDCVLKKLSETESLSAKQNIAYIGQGRFAVISRENPSDAKHFKIEKIIEWEDKNNPGAWRSEMAELYSKVK
ncbi:MAG: hypothetical protein K6A42_09895 [Treponema sp.]|nr:hypothetical protein [Treponema sp.]